MPVCSLVSCLLLIRCVALFLHRQTLFAAVTAPLCSLSRLPQIWFCVHALQFGFANQTVPGSLSVDLLNHPDRSLPAGRIFLRTARTLHWIMIPMSCGVRCTPKYVDHCICWSTMLAMECVPTGVGLKRAECDRIWHRGGGYNSYYLYVPVETT
jgi:hypothetical protein